MSDPDPSLDQDPPEPPESTEPDEPTEPNEPVEPPEPTDPTYPIYCSGPGPHEPEDGILGESTVEDAPGYLCELCANRQPPPAPDPTDDLALQAEQVATGSPWDLAPLWDRNL